MSVTLTWDQEFVFVFVCDACGAERHVKRAWEELAFKSLRRDGWRLVETETGLEWRCPECRIIDRFAPEDEGRGE